MPQLQQRRPGLYRCHEVFHRQSAERPHGSMRRRKRASVSDAISAEHAVEPGEGSLLVRWVPDELWPVVHGGVAPCAAVLVDLL